MIAITGASGHVGANLTRALVAEGRKVRALVHEGGRALDGVELERVAADVLDPASLDRGFDGVETVYHLAARISVMGDPGGHVRAVNVEGTRNVVAAARRAGVKRLVHFSSIHALSPFPLDQPIDEERPLYDEPGALAYERSKAAGEREVLAGVAEGLDAVIVNPTGIIGRYDFEPSAMGTVLLDLFHRRLPALVAGGFDWVDVRDVVAGAIAAERKGRSGHRYLLSGNWVPFREFGEIVERVTGVKRPRLSSPMWLARAGAPFAELFSRMTGRRALFTSESLKALRHWRHVSHEKAARELGFSARPVEDTINDAYAWFFEAGVIRDRRVA